MVEQANALQFICILWIWAINIFKKETSLFVSYTDHFHNFFWSKYSCGVVFNKNLSYKKTNVIKELYIIITETILSSKHIQNLTFTTWQLSSLAFQLPQTPKGNKKGKTSHSKIEAYSKVSRRVGSGWFV